MRLCQTQIRGSLTTLIVACSSVLGLAISGCGGSKEALPDLGQVSGTVTLNGQPLSDARVLFIPDNGPASAAITDQTGRYELLFKSGDKGAVIGRHEVQISTDLEGTMNPQDEKVPAKYNQSSTLTQSVQAGENTINFDL